MEGRRWKGGNQIRQITRDNTGNERLVNLIYLINCGVIQGFPALRKAVKNIFFTCIDIANQLLIRHSPLAPLGQVDE